MTVNNFEEQRETTSKTRSKKEATELTQTAIPINFSWAQGVPRTSYNAGKTISLGNYQFARVGVTIEIEHKSSEEASDDVYEVAKYLAKEIVSQEEASIKKEERERGEFKTGDYTKFRLTLDYGLTLKTGKFDSAKVDIALTRYASLRDLSSTLNGMRELLSLRLREEAKEIKG
tara:strand:+ start:3579 stop:4100 length:522 start_codon:yes stop_codon:yes gene_type:complete